MCRSGVPVKVARQSQGACDGGAWQSQVCGIVVRVTSRSPRARTDRLRVVGRAGEDAAAAWYESQGYRILDRNWSCRMGELDIVARRGRLYVFSEVKARTSDTFGLPAEAVGALKQARVRRLAALWFAGASGDGSSRGPGGPVRFDVVSVLNGQLEVIEGAF